MFEGEREVFEPRVIKLKLKQSDLPGTRKWKYKKQRMKPQS